MTHRSRRLSRWLPWIALMIMLSGAGVCADEETGWRLRIDFGVVNPRTDQGVVEVEGTTVSVNSDTGAGVGARGEYQFSTRLGVEVGAFASASFNIEASAAIGNVGTTVEINSFTPLSFGLNVHLIPKSRLDLYLGPLLAYSVFNDVGVRAEPGGSTTYVSVDNDLGFGGILGLDLPIGKKGWVFNLNLRYIKTKMEGRDGEDRVDVDYDPTIFSIGFGYRF